MCDLCGKPFDGGAHRPIWLTEVDGSLSPDKMIYVCDPCYYGLLGPEGARLEREAMAQGSEKWPSASDAYCFLVIREFYELQHAFHL